MKRFESNLEPSLFVPSLPLNPNEVVQTITSVNGHTIESLESSAAFNRSSGCELDRLINASRDLRSFVNSDKGKLATSIAKQLSNS